MKPNWRNKTSIHYLVVRDGIFRRALPGRVIGGLAVDVRWSRLLGTVVSSLLGCLVVGMLGIKGDAVFVVGKKMRGEGAERDETGKYKWLHRKRCICSSGVLLCLGFLFLLKSNLSVGWLLFSSYRLKSSYLAIVFCAF